jgi:chitinase
MAEQTQTPDFEHLDADQLLDRLIATRATIAKLQAEDDAMLDRLDQLAEAGEVDQGGFSHNDWSFSWSAGRKSYEYPDAIINAQKVVEQAKKAAKADGSATETLGTPFWTIRAPKP